MLGTLVSPGSALQPSPRSPARWLGRARADRAYPRSAFVFLLDG